MIIGETFIPNSLLKFSAASGNRKATKNSNSLCSSFVVFPFNALPASSLKDLPGLNSIIDLSKTFEDLFKSSSIDNFFSFGFPTKSGGNLFGIVVSA